jgi:hypothetical protein
MFASSSALRRMFDDGSLWRTQRASVRPQAGPMVTPPTCGWRCQVVIGFPDDQTAVQATRTLIERGIEPCNIDRYHDSQRHLLLADLLARRPTSMAQERARACRYLEWAEPGCGWLVVEVAGGATTREVMSVAACLGATTGWLSEETQ